MFNQQDVENHNMMRLNNILHTQQSKKKKIKNKIRIPFIKEEIFLENERSEMAVLEANRMKRRQEMLKWVPTSGVIKQTEMLRNKRSHAQLSKIAELYQYNDSDQNISEKIVECSSQQNIIQECNEEVERMKESKLQQHLINLTQMIEYVGYGGGTAPCKLTGCRSQQFQNGARSLSHLPPICKGNVTEKKKESSLPLLSGQSCKKTNIGPRTKIQNLKRNRSASVLKNHVQSLRLINEGLYDDEMELTQFLALHRKSKIMESVVIKLQAIWRMQKRYRAFKKWMLRRRNSQRFYFKLWIMSQQVSQLAQRSTRKRYIRAWREEVDTSIRLREMELKLYREAETRFKLPRIVINLVFTSMNVHRKFQTAQLDAEEKSKEKMAISKPFYSAVFDCIIQQSRKATGRVPMLKLVHQAARDAIKRKIVQQIFRVWQRVHQSKTRTTLSASLCIKRAVRIAFNNRPIWASEKIMVIFEIWARYTAFCRCKRLTIPMPYYTQSLPLWDIWLYNYQEKRIRKIKALARAPLALMRRSFRVYKIFIDSCKRKKSAIITAQSHFQRNLFARVIKSWVTEVADQCWAKKLSSTVFEAMRYYSTRKVLIRQAGNTVFIAHAKFLYKRVLYVWHRIQLRTKVNRLFQSTRLVAHSCNPTYRRLALSVLYMWLNYRSQVIKKRVFTGWKHYYHRRKLFLTLGWLCNMITQRNLLFCTLISWKTAIWVSGSLEPDVSLRLHPGEAYGEVATYLPSLFYGSFSYASALFGGIPLIERKFQTNTYDFDRSSNIEVNHFHRLLQEGSLAEIRNEILTNKHVLNISEESTGVTALHIAARIIDPLRRFEVISLLLAEGALTSRRRDYRGQTPLEIVQYDKECQELLTLGVYSFFSRKVSVKGSLNIPSKECSSAIWHTLTLMSNEVANGLRTTGKCLSTSWHSVLTTEEWLRHDKMYFNLDSTHCGPVRLCTAFLHSMKKEMLISRDDYIWKFLRQSCVLNSISDQRASDIKHVLERDSIIWGVESPISNWKTISHSDNLISPCKTLSDCFHEYEVYKCLVSPWVDDYDKIETSLLQNFVSLLVYLDFSQEEIKEQAQLLSTKCEELQNQILTQNRELRVVENKLMVQALSRYSNPDLAHAIKSVRLFSKESDLTYYFDRVKSDLECQLYKTRSCTLEKFFDSHSDPALKNLLTTKVNEITAIVHRQLRKTDKLISSLEQQLRQIESEYFNKLQSSDTKSSMQEICNMRLMVEKKRLEIVSQLVKRDELVHWSQTFDRHEQMLCGLSKETDTLKYNGEYNDEGSIFEAIRNIEGLYLDCQKVFLIKQEIQRVDNDVVPRKLSKLIANSTKLLIATNLLRSCCCLIDDQMTNLGSNKKSQSLELEKSCSTRNLLIEFRDKRHLRRNSIVKGILQDYALHSSSNHACDKGVRDILHDCYAKSGELLFQLDREILCDHYKKLRHEQQMVQAHYLQINPISNEPECTPIHLLNVEKGCNIVDTIKGNATNLHHNRKKSTINLSLVKYKASSLMIEDRDESPEKNNSNELYDTTIHSGSLSHAISASKELSFIEGLEFEFGNFAIKSMVKKHPYKDTFALDLTPITPDIYQSLNVEADCTLWKSTHSNKPTYSSQQSNIKSPKAKGEFSPTLSTTGMIASDGLKLKEQADVQIPNDAVDGDPTIFKIAETSYKPTTQKYEEKNAENTNNKVSIKSHYKGSTEIDIRPILAQPNNIVWEDNIEKLLPVYVDENKTPSDRLNIDDDSVIKSTKDLLLYKQKENW